MQTVDLSFHDAVGSGVLPKLPAEIYEDRFERCRALMEEQSLDVRVVYSAAMPFASCEWARYFANYAHPYWNSETFVVIPRKSDPVFLINYGFMLDVARASSPIEDVRPRWNGSGRHRDTRASRKRCVGSSATRA